MLRLALWLALVALQVRCVASLSLPPPKSLGARLGDLATTAAAKSITTVADVVRESSENNTAEDASDVDLAAGAAAGVAQAAISAGFLANVAAGFAKGAAAVTGAVVLGPLAKVATAIPVIATAMAVNASGAVNRSAGESLEEGLLVAYAASLVAAEALQPRQRPIIDLTKKLEGSVDAAGPGPAEADAAAAAPLTSAPPERASPHRSQVAKRVATLVGLYALAARLAPAVGLNAGGAAPAIVRRVYAFALLPMALAKLALAKLLVALTGVALTGVAATRAA